MARAHGTKYFQLPPITLFPFSTLIFTYTHCSFVNEIWELSAGSFAGVFCWFIRQISTGTK